MPASGMDLSKLYVYHITKDQAQSIKHQAQSIKDQAQSINTNSGKQSPDNTLLQISESFGIIDDDTNLKKLASTDDDNNLNKLASTIDDNNLNKLDSTLEGKVLEFQTQVRKDIKRAMNNLFFTYDDKNGERKTVTLDAVLSDNTKQPDNINIKSVIEDIAQYMNRNSKVVLNNKQIESIVIGSNQAYDPANQIPMFEHTFDLDHGAFDVLRLDQEKGAEVLSKEVIITQDGVKLETKAVFERSDFDAKIIGGVYATTSVDLTKVSEKDTNAPPYEISIYSTEPLRVLETLAEESVTKHRGLANLNTADRAKVETILGPAMEAKQANGHEGTQQNTGLFHRIIKFFREDVPHFFSTILSNISNAMNRKTQTPELQNEGTDANNSAPSSPGAKEKQIVVHKPMGAEKPPPPPTKKRENTRKNGITP